MNTNHVLDTNVSFNEMDLDDFITHQLYKQKFIHPTLIQSQFIPIALQGKDIITKAKTGSGKTLAYAIPILHNLLTTQQNSHIIRALILTPSRELCFQCKNVFDSLLKGYYGISVLNVASDTSLTSQKGKVRGNPDILIATPATLLSYIKKTGAKLDNVDVIVFDEVDLMIAYGYESDCRELIKLLPNNSKKWMLSATVNDDVGILKNLIMKNAVKISMEDDEIASIDEYVITCTERSDKLLNLYVLLKLGMVRGKVLIFVNSIERSFYVKLFLDLFSISSVVLNSDLPRDIRTHVIEQFNNNEFNILIATDEVTIEKVLEEKKANLMELDSKENYSVSRGIDFQNVSCVINFDCPPTVISYIHRIGRTGRGLKSGTSITISTKEDINIIKQIKEERDLKEYKIDEPILGSFKTRVYDIQQKVTKNACKEARVKDYRREMGNEQKLTKSLGSIKFRHTAALSGKKTTTSKRFLNKQNEYEVVDQRKKKRYVTKPKRNTEKGKTSFVKKMSKKF
ncbi:RNA helicase [Entamoeba marina]